MKTFFSIIARSLIIAVVAGSIFAAEEPLPGKAVSARPLRVLLLSGQNNHDWKTTTPKIQSLLEATGRFQVDRQEQPERITAQSLQPYDVIVSNWNNWMPARKGTGAAVWPEEVRRAYLEFVHGGKGHVVVHAGSSSFFDWKEYQELALASWKLGQTGHGPQHEFPVRIEAAHHPITRGLKDFTTRDELWNRPGVQPGATVLASSWSSAESKGTGRYEPAALAGKSGRGRAFTLLLGHDAAAMENPGFAALLVRGAEWAATGEVAAATSDGP